MLRGPRIGINVMPAAYPPEVAAQAGSLEGELGRAVPRGVVLAECLAAIWRRCDAGTPDERPYWRTGAGRAAATFGRRVEWDTPTGLRIGTARDVDASGALVVAAEDQVGG